MDRWLDGRLGEVEDSPSISMVPAAFQRLDVVIHAEKGAEGGKKKKRKKKKNRRFSYCFVFACRRGSSVTRLGHMDVKYKYESIDLQTTQTISFSSATVLPQLEYR